MSKEYSQPVVQLKDLEEGRAHVVEVDGEEVLLTLKDGAVCACGNSCPHYGASLSDGRIVEGKVVCPWHYAEFDLETGNRSEPPAVDDIPRWKTRVEEGAVYLVERQAPEIPMPQGEDARRFLIIGGGAAGQAAAETLRREGFAGEIILFSDEEELPYDRPSLSKIYLSGGVDRGMLPLRPAEFYSRLNIDLRLNRRVVSMDPRAKLVELEDGSRESGQMILLATGSRPRRIPVEGFDGPGCYLLRSLEDADILTAELADVRHAVLIGAGFIALEAASSLRSRGIGVTIVAPERVLLEKVFGAEIGKRIQAIHESEGVEFRLGTSAAEILRDGGVSGVLLKDGTSIDADCVLMAVGVTPRIDCLEGTDLAEEGEIRVDAGFQTREPGIFAAGDIARFPHRLGTARIEHWITAQKEGIQAARSMLGKTDQFSEIPVFWTKQYAYSFKYIGFGGEFDRTVIRGSLEEDSWIAGHYRGSTLVGASSFGRGGELLAVRDAMAAGKSIAPEAFEAGEFD